MGALSSPPSFLNPRLKLLHQTPGPAQESSDIDFTPAASPSSVIFANTSVARLRTLLAHPSSSSPNGRYSFMRRGGNSFDMSEMDVTPVVNRAREWQKDRRESLGGNEDNGSNINVSPPSSTLRESGSSIQTRALVSTSAASPHSVPDSPLKFAGSEGEGQTMPPSSTRGTPSLTSSASQNGPEVERPETNITLVRVDEDSFAHLNYTTMKTSRPPGAWSLTPIPLKHAPRVTSPPPVSSSELTPAASSSWMPLSLTNPGPERRSRSEATTGNDNDLFTPIHPLSRAKSLHVRTPAPPGAWMSSTTTQNWSNERSKFGSIRAKKNILKVRFDVTESEASTAEVEHQEPRTIADMPMPALSFLPDDHASRSGKVPKTRINGSSQGDAVDDPVLDRPVIPEHHMTPTSRANPSSSRSQRKTFSVKVVDAFGREMIDELPVAIANGDAGDAICVSILAETRTPRVSTKNEIRIIDTRGAEVQEDVLERPSMAVHDGPPICRTAALAQIRQTLREWASGLSDEDRYPDNLALNPSYSKELEERSRVARRSRNQLARTLRIESAKECKRNLMHKYTKRAEGRSGLLPTITGENGSFHRDLVWVGVLLQIVFVLAMWWFAHVQARRLFCAVYYDPHWNPRMDGHVWETWAERPNEKIWPPT